MTDHASCTNLDQFRVPSGQQLALEVLMLVNLWYITVSIYTERRIKIGGRRGRRETNRSDIVTTPVVPDFGGEPPASENATLGLKEHVLMCSANFGRWVN